jgi:hypothetical protein
MKEKSIGEKGDLTRGSGIRQSLSRVPTRRGKRTVRGKHNITGGTMKIDGGKPGVVERSVQIEAVAIIDINFQISVKRNDEVRIGDLKVMHVNGVKFEIDKLSIIGPGEVLIEHHRQGRRGGSIKLGFSEIWQIQGVNRKSRDWDIRRRSRTIRRGRGERRMRKNRGMQERGKKQSDVGANVGLKRREGSLYHV